MSTSISDGTWSFDPVHSSIGFRVKHLGVSTFRGSFPGIQGAITTSGGAITSIEGTVDMASLNAQDDNLSGHLQSDDFFAVEAHPQGRFRSTSITSAPDGILTIEGEIMLRGIAKPLTLSPAVPKRPLSHWYLLPEYGEMQPGERIGGLRGSPFL